MAPVSPPLPPLQHPITVAVLDLGDEALLREVSTRLGRPLRPVRLSAPRDPEGAARAVRAGRGAVGVPPDAPAGARDQFPARRPGDRPAELDKARSGAIALAEVLRVVPYRMIATERQPAGR